MKKSIANDIKLKTVEQFNRFKINIESSFKNNEISQEELYDLVGLGEDFITKIAMYLESSSTNFNYNGLVTNFKQIKTLDEKDAAFEIFIQTLKAVCND